mmetsp:Transcript_34116/g.25176  ORF Transcript_34116/g.25176 Transcript_34116/m.25176 type:complete len:202 (-) Transcript_34116:2790-3395(-)
MMLDIDTPILNKLEINGRLTFLNTTDIHLHAHYIFVRAGELIIGSEEAPYEQNAQITLYGYKNTSHIVFENTIEAGDKVLVNTGRMEMHGKPRQGYRSRLLGTAYPGDTNVELEPMLGWQPGDVIGFAPTALLHNDSDFAVVVSYEQLTGWTELDRPLTGYHWGTSPSQSFNYNGVDMRGEVFLINRNIKINGEDIEAWGC